MLPDEFRIRGESSQGYRIEIMRADHQSWVGVVEFGGQVWVARTPACPAFGAALDTFEQLPPIYPGPYELRNNPDPRQFGARTPHAEDWTLRLAAFTPDYTRVDLEMRGSQGPYPRWASETVEAIKSCGPPEP